MGFLISHYSRDTDRSSETGGDSFVISMHFVGAIFGALVCLGVVVLLLPQPIALAVLPGVAIFSAGAFFFGFWPHYRDASRRRRTRYALTNRRAVVAEVDRQGRVSVKSYPIRLDTPLGGGHDRVIFATERRMARGRGYDADVGFERIGAEARVVHDHIIAIKARRAAEDA